MCKLEIMRLDKKFEWYEVRSSMRLAWLMTKQMIIPVEVICSFQQMHSDSPAGNANSIVARLQKVSAGSYVCTAARDLELGRQKEMARAGRDRREKGRDGLLGKILQ